MNGIQNALTCRHFLYDFVLKGKHGVLHLTPNSLSK